MKVGYQVLVDLQQQQAFKQWGFTVFDPAYYKNVNFTLPLSVNGTFCAFSTGYDAKGSTFLWHSMSHFNNVNVGVTGFVFDSRYTFTGLGYLAVCWQKQWGINTGGAVRTSTLPIPFTNVFLAVASTSSEWCCPGCSATNTTVTTRAYQSNRPDVAQPNDVNWIIIGCQPQWGYQKQLTVEPVVYPLPVNTVCCVWAHSIHDRQDPGTYHSILSKITPVGVQILAGQYNAPATAYSGISAYWGMIGC